MSAGLQDRQPQRVDANGEEQAYQRVDRAPLHGTDQRNLGPRASCGEHEQPDIDGGLHAGGCGAPARGERKHPQTMATAAAVPATSPRGSVIRLYWFIRLYGRYS
jgi:hypothetical protein